MKVQIITDDGRAVETLEFDQLDSQPRIERDRAVRLIYDAVERAMEKETPLRNVSVLEYAEWQTD